MGRSERPIDGDVESLCQFAAELRELRRKAGSPTYREMAARVHYSASVLSQAASGRSLPTLAVTVAFVEACGGDRRPWERRWQATAAAVHAAGRRPAAVGASPAGPVTPGAAADPAGPQNEEAAGPGVAQHSAEPGITDDDAPDGPVPAAPVTAPPRSGRWRAATLVAGAVAAALVGAGALRSWDARPAPTPASHPPTTPAQARDPVVDGADPERSGCAADGVTIDSQPLIFPRGRLAGTVELRYSAHCRVGWTRFTPAPASGRGAGDTVTVVVVRPTDGARQRFTITYGDLAVYGNILSTERGCVRAEAFVTTGGGTSPVTATGCHTGPP